MNDTDRNPMDDRDDVAKLIRLAGKRQAVPAERAARVRDAAHVQWRLVVQRRRRRRAWIAGLSAAAALLAVAVLVLRVPPGETAVEIAAGTARVELLTGSARSRTVDDGSAVAGALAVGDALGGGTELETDSDGRCAIRLASGHSVRLDRSTVIRLVGDEVLALDRGAIYIDSGPDGSSEGRLSVQTPLGAIEEIGTQFEVRLGSGAVRVRLREGAVIVRGESDTHEVRAGDELELGSDGTVTRRTLSKHDPDWDWTVGLAPMLALEGRTAREFLEWIARERGWELTFEDERVARAAEEIVLGGTTERLTVDEALEAVLPTCRMRHRVEDGTLLIAMAP